MDRLIVKVKDFSKTPGTRHINEGVFSGEKFRQQVLDREFKKALDKNAKLIVNLDGTIGYSTSWLEEVFGGLARDCGKENVEKTLEFISDEEPYLIEDINGYIKDV